MISGWRDVLHLQKVLFPELSEQRLARFATLTGQAGERLDREDTPTDASKTEDFDTPFRMSSTL